MDIDTFLRNQEGYKLQAYPDPVSGGAPWTIGIGHTGPEVHPGLIWNDDQVMFAYQLDKAHAWQGCVDNMQPWFLQLNDPRQAVLWSMCFQMGIGRVGTPARRPEGLLAFQNTLANVRDEHYANAAEGMRQSAWAKQTPSRVMLEASMMETGNW